ncbi:nitric oxide reductase activation protein NorD [Mycolicibacterium parafortuitum]|uniref:von Willebrand factor type A [Sphaerobacter thermophilus DSM] n=1 Tax=Mycolicibacterium parafortuitum TaxID=39692 RepID=A0A375YQ86_MYCPF|nr:VWA domain-containing protein [Mycolicibacterium parafortuitum]ORB29624.1 VWA domain-containing protein [Mycolicibacterium parafortuitum]SRX83199.1 von Willebrand factor type A [Sphaerobacter thermophilus DSM] [Mycolicibacterium parafortuitum]
MTTSEPAEPHHLRLLAGHLAGYAVDIAEAPAGEPAYTDGRVVYVSHGAAHDERRREVLVQSALLGAGSLDPSTIRPLRARASWSRRYLAIEGRRVLADVATRLPLAAAVSTWGAPETTSAAESLELARSRTRVAEAPSWFGVLKPARVGSPPAQAGTQVSGAELRFEIASTGDEDDPDDGDGPPEESKILKLFDNPLFNSQAVGDFLRKLLGSSPGASANSPGGAELRVGAARRGQVAGPGARPLPTRIQFTDDANPGAAVGVGGALYPEWDVFSKRYRPEWCRVIDYPFTAAADVSAAAVAPDNVLRHRLSRVGLGPKVLRRRADGDDLDIEALVDLTVDLRSGFSPPEQVYTEHRKVARNLGVLILLDASGSATDADPQGLAVHEHQRRAAATIAATLEDLGDRVAVYAFRSKGRAVHLPAIKTFEQRFGAISRARLTQLRPANYTRLGAAVRGAGEIVKAQAGTPNRLLLVLSDGHPYDDGYEGRYAEADARKALEELRADGVACLCLSIGAATDADALERVFGSASYAAGAALGDLSMRMDELFLGALRELAVPRTPPAYARVNHK